MLNRISPLLSPDLLKAMAEMGHGDELILSDAHFPAHSCCQRVIRADGLLVDQLLGAMLPLFPLDTYATPLIMMAPVKGDSLDLGIEERFMKAIRVHEPAAPVPARLAREEFYARAKGAYVCVVTGDLAKYGNLILKKGIAQP